MRTLHGSLAALGLSFLVQSAPLQAAAFDLEGQLGDAAGFTVLGLNNGDVIINSATSITGDVGYSSGVVSNTNQKVDTFDGTVYLHSNASVTTTPATFAPSGGTQTGTAVDSLLDSANSDAAATSQFLANASAGSVGQGVTFAEFNLGSLGDNDSRTINTTGSGGGDINAGDVDFVRLNLDSLLYKEDQLTLIGDSSDIFLFNVAGDFFFSGSQIQLQGVTWENVIFNVLNASTVSINKANTAFNGRILATEGTVLYHNPATFNGGIIANSINLHSDFNISGPTQSSAPVPAPIGLTLAGLLSMGLIHRRRQR